MENNVDIIFLLLTLLFSFLHNHSSNGLTTFYMILGEKRKDRKLALCLKHY